MRPTSLAQSRRYVLLFSILLFLAPAASTAGNPAPASIIFTENFESGWGWWYADNGVWDVGTPTHGPAAAFEGIACAGTTLDGPYPRNANSRLISPPITLPASPEGDGLWLDLENWFALGAGDMVMIEITDNGTVTWQSLGTVFASASECWSHHRTMIDVTEYAGDTVQIALHVVDDGGAAVNPAGFFLDLFTVWDGAPFALTLPADFENGDDGWYADNGTWQIGQPTVGPMGGHASDSCAGTRIDGPYAQYANSRLVSPLVDLGTPAGGDALLLTFRHWGSVVRNDVATVTISTDGTSWETIHLSPANTNEEWVQYFVDVTAYAGQTVRFGFALTDDGGSGANGDGWFIDDVDVIEGPPRTWPPTEGFENGLAGWSTEGGLWEIGTPTSGPGLPAAGQFCAGTNLAGNYTVNDDARLISPPVALTASPADGVLQLSFWQWFSVYNAPDYLDVEIRTDTEPWTSIHRVTPFYSECWSRLLLDISAYAGQTIQLAFRLRDDGSYSGYVSTGWYLDELDILEGQPGSWTHEGFESGLGGWSMDNGAWEIGEPTSGPGQASQGVNCAATNLDGNYIIGADARLISPPTTLAASPADGVLQLSLWQWFAVYNAPDYLDVEIKTETESWTSIHQVIPFYSECWSRLLLDISAYAGQTVQFAFHLRDDGSYSGYVAAGWYIDEIDILEGQPESWTHEDFENGLGDWSMDNGTWEIGEPTSGPGQASNGLNCAATNLDGNYIVNANARLISPPTTLTASPEDGVLQLSLWQWFAVYNAPDYLDVEIRTEAEPWTSIYQVTPYYSQNWTRLLLDISAYAGQTVQFAFHLRDDGSYSGYVNAGWYIDEIVIQEGVPDSWTHEGFEAGLDGWSMDNGTWEIGEPTSGPGQASHGVDCAATNLDGNYIINANARLISPPTALAASPADGVLRLSLWQWFAVYNASDFLDVEVRTETEPWTSIHQVTPFYSECWSRLLLDISAYAGQTVQFAFHLRDDGSYSGYVNAGWYIDEIDILEGRSAPWTHEDFENGLGDWSMDNGTWEIGTPEAGPDRASHGTNCAATNLDGNYIVLANARLVSPEIALDFSQDSDYWVSFWHWYAVYNAPDYLTVEVLGTSGQWDVLQALTPYRSGVWTRTLVDLSAYAGQTVRLAFHLRDDGSYSGYVSSGWYIDEIDILGEQPALTSPFNFENADWAQTADMGGWSVDGGVWEAGRPTAGPGAALEGDHCAGTILAGNYLANADTRLISPPLELGAAPLGGDLWFSYWHWYSFYGNDFGVLEIRTPESAWTPITDTFTSVSGGWTQSIVDLSDHAGHIVQLAFHFHDDPTHSSHVAAGWYIDKVSLVEGPMLYNNPEYFETRTKGWSAEAGSWQIGEPTVGPNAAHEGQWCAGTVLDGNYPRYADTRIISPKMTLPAGPLARFYQWFQLAASDSALFEISVDGGGWVQLAGFTTTADWTPYVSNLSAYAGQDVRFAFHLKDANNDGVQAAGWYVDSFEILNMPVGGPDAPVFHDVTYSADTPVLRWDIVAADHTHMAVYAGHFDAYVPDLGNRIALTTDEPYLDVAHPGWRSGYFISSVTALWQESDLVAPGEVIGVEDETPSYATALGQNYPNPFNPTTVVTFTLARDAGVVIEIFDVAGHKVATLLQERLEAGRYEIPFDGRRHASGVYFCRFQTEGFSEVRKMALVK